jgi:hypothetical protein
MYWLTGDSSGSRMTISSMPSTTVPVAKPSPSDRTLTAGTVTALGSV